MAKALRAGFHRTAHRVWPAPFGSRDRVTRYKHCGSPEIVEGFLCRFSVEGGVLVVDRGLSAGGAVAAMVVVEAVAPLQYDRLGVVSGFEVVSGQDFPFQAGEERLGGGVVEARPDPAHGLGDLEPAAEFGEVVRGVGRAAVGVEDDAADLVDTAAGRDG